MSKTRELVDNIQKNLNQLISLSAKYVYWAQILALIIFPVSELLLEMAFDTPKNIWYTVAIFHVLVAIYAFMGAEKVMRFLSNSEFEKLIETVKEERILFDTEVKQNKELNASIESLVKQAAEVQGALSVLHSILETHNSNKNMTIKTKETASSEVGKILAPLIKNRAEIMRFNSSEKYNFGVYLYNKKDKKLQLLYRDCDNRIKRHDRSWASGKGHVGFAFFQKRTIISPDMTDSPSSEIWSSDSMVGDDRELYKSFISTPIFNSVARKDSSNPIGVLVITSDRSGHLDQEYKIVTETFALLLSLYFSSCEIQ